MTEDQESRRDARIFVGLVIGGIVVFVLALALGSALNATLGSFADWIAAVSTFAALLAAAYAAVHASRAFTLENDRDEERTKDARQWQAAQVAVWSGPTPRIGPLVTRTWEAGEPGRIRVASIISVDHLENQGRKYASLWFSLPR